MVICLERCADLHMAQLMPLPLTIFCFSKIQIGFTIVVPAHPGSHGQGAVKRVCVCDLFNATRWFLWHSDFTKFDFGRGFAPYPAGGAYDAPQTP